MPGAFLKPAYVPDAPALARRLHLTPGSEEEAEFFVLLERAATEAEPKAACHPGTVAEMPNGACLFVATCGEKLDRAAEGLDVLERFWFETIMRDALATAESAARRFAATCCGHGHLAMIGPGSLPEWPLEGQKELFSLLAGEAAFCGIRLDGNCIMRPLKSSSGVFVPVREGWTLCRACSREECLERVRFTQSSPPCSAP